MGQIFAIGGYDYGRDQALLDVTISLIGKSNPSIGILTTASGDDSASIEKIQNAFSPFSCTTEVYSFFKKNSPLEAFIENNDAFFVTGGNVKSMLGVWREWGMDQALIRANLQGKLLAGWSAGGICWFDSMVTDSWAERIVLEPGLGLINGCCCPHYEPDNVFENAPESLISTVYTWPFLGISNVCGVLYNEGKIEEIYVSHSEARAVEFKYENNQFQTIALEASGISKP